MPGLSPVLDLTARTFEALRNRGLDLLARRSGPVVFQDFQSTGIATAIIDVVSWFHEQQVHYHERRYRNSFLFLADTREAMLILARAQGYRMRPATSAAISVIADPLPPQVAPITLAAGTRVAVGDLVFEVAQNYIIPAGAVSWPDGSTDDLIILSEGVTREEVFISDGNLFQRFDLGVVGVIDGSVTVTILGQVWDEVANLTFVEFDTRGRDSYTGDGADFQEYVLSLLNANIELDDEDGLLVLVTPLGQTSAQAQVWQQVSDFTGAPLEYTASQNSSGETTIRFGTDASGAAPLDGSRIDILYLVGGAQKRYQLTYDEFDKARIMFGDDEMGVIPPVGAEIRVRYRTGGGVRGNVAAGTIDQSIQGILPTGARTPVRIRNLGAGRGGEPQETVDHARYFAPRFARANRRAVTQDDFTALAATYRDAFFGAPSHASAFLKQKVPELNTVCVALWSRDDSGRLADPGAALKLGVKNYLDSRRTITTTTEMKDGVVVVIDMELAITLDPGRDRNVVFGDVTTAIERFFNSAYVLPGLDLSISRLYDAIQSVDGVARAIITNLTGSVRVNITLGPGDGVATEFSGDFVLEDGSGVVPGSVVVTDGTQQGVDDQEGSFTGPDVDGGGTNVMDYDDGKFTVTFAAAPPIGSVVTAEAQLLVHAPHTEVLGSSDGTPDSLVLDGATVYYPIVRRGPRGMWAGDQSLVVDDFRIGTSNEFRGRLPRGINPGSIVIEDNVPGAPILSAFDNGAGGIVGDVLTGSVDYTTGDISWEFNAAPALPVRIRWTTNRVNVYMPSEFLPLEPGRVFVWAGFRGIPNGTQAGGADLNATDDGAGNMTGDTLVGGTVTYETGELDFEWNALPPPGIQASSWWGYLLEAPDGVRADFTFEVRDAPGGGGSLVDLREGANDGVGRTRLRLSDLSRPGLTIADAWDNWQGAVDGVSLDREEPNTIAYDPAQGPGTLNFVAPLQAGTTQDFRIFVTNVGIAIYSAWVFRVKTPGGPGLDKHLFADNNGRLWGTNVNAFPTDRLDHLRGRYIAQLSPPDITAGRTLELTYDALINVPPAEDIPLQGDQVASIGRITLREKAPELTSLS